ncbi:MAG: hypothetical protein JNG83_09635 [Opitutaceae bacterium]|nr:hypothetical protein [Opitutaceae bacterium]
MILAFVLLAGGAEAGLVGWLTATTRSWEFVQATGGIKINEPVLVEGRLLLPVEYDATGTTAVTRAPTLANSGLTVRRIKVRRAAQGVLTLEVVTQVIEKNQVAGRFHYAEIAGLPSGAYEVYYGSAEDPERRLGSVRLR